MAFFNRNKNKDKDSKSNASSANQFEYDGKKYDAIKPAQVPIDGKLEKLTPADICSSTEAQQYLVENKCSCIVEAIDNN